MQIDLNGKHALVCGSSDGIGKAIAIGLAAAGAHVTLFARNAEKLGNVFGELPNRAGQQHSILVADFNDNEAVKKTVEDALLRNPYHILINNTGGPPAGPVETATVEAFESAFRNHLINNHNLSQLVLPGMRSEGYGRIINIISTSVKIPLKGLGVSNTIRGAVASWSKTLSNEVAKDGITVNNVLPGATGTGRLSSIIENKSAKTGHSKTDVEAAMLTEIPMQRFGTPEEVANAAVFLASPQAAYITGVSLAVDGGRTGSL